MTILRLLVVATVLVLPVFSQQYQLQDFAVGTVLYPTSINNAGIIVGFGGGGFVRFADGTIRSGLRIPGSSGTAFYSINNFGIIAGAFDFGAESTAMLIESGTVTVKNQWRHISAINGNGDFVGTLADSTGPFGDRDALSVAGVVTTIDFPGAWTTSLSGIGADNTVVGTYRTFDGRYHAFLRGPNGKFLGIRIAGGRDVFPNDINSAAGKIVGRFMNANSRVVGFIYDYKADLAAVSAADPVIKTIPIQEVVYPDALSTIVTGINAKSVITGYARAIVDHREFHHAFVGTPVDQTGDPGATLVPEDK